MSTVTMQDLDKGIIVFLRLLERVPEQVALDRPRLERLQKELESLRLDALAAEFKAKYPDIPLDYDLLRLVGIDSEDIPQGEEMALLTEILEQTYGNASAN